MIWAIGTFVFDSKLGRMAVAAFGALVLFSAWLWQHDRRVEARVEQKIITNSVEAGKKANAKATKAHDAAARPGAFDRLLKSSCRDCN